MTTAMDWQLKWWKAQRENAATASRRVSAGRSGRESPPDQYPTLPDHEHRLRDIEQKLDRILELLEDCEKPRR